MKPLCCGTIKQGLQTTYIFDRQKFEVTQITQTGSPVPKSEGREKDVRVLAER